MTDRQQDLRLAEQVAEMVADRLGHNCYLRKRAAARYLGISVSKLEKHIAEITHYRIGRCVVLKKPDLDAWMKQHQVAPTASTNRVIATAEEMLRTLRGDSQ